jgi:hypothetical protein
MTLLASVFQLHTATARPLAFIASRGFAASWASSERSTGVPNVPPGGLIAPRTTVFPPPPGAVNTIAPPPFSSIATSGVGPRTPIKKHAVVAPTSWGGPKLPPAGRNADCTV